MAIKDWHLGQLAVLWIGGLLFEYFLLFLSLSLRMRWAGIAVWIWPFVVLTITWQWFGTRPRK